MKANKKRLKMKMISQKVAASTKAKTRKEELKKLFDSVEEADNDPIKEIKKSLEELRQLEKIGSKKALRWKIRIGKYASIEKERLEKEGKPFRPFVKEHFKESVNRVYEALAINRAISSGVSKLIGTTALIKIGQGMEAKDKNVSDFYKAIVENSYIKDEGKIIHLKGNNKAEILSALRKRTMKPELKLPDVLDEKIEELKNGFLNISPDQKEQISNKMKKWVSILQDLMKNAK